MHTFYRFLLRSLLLIGIVFGYVPMLMAQITTGTDLNTVQRDNQGRPMSGSNKNADTLQHRDPNADSLTIFYKYFDSSRARHIDSSINDFNIIMPAPYTYTDLGNPGSPAQSLLFRPLMKAGWDPGFHAMDVYKLKLEDTKYYTTTRPYTSLTYMSGSHTEQFINVLHTQNRKSTVNFTFEFNLTSDPGIFKNQNTNNSNFRFNISSQSKNKRYSINLIYLTNSMKAGANGGIVSEDALTNNALGDPFYVATKLGSTSLSNQNPFRTNVSLGNVFSDNTLFLRHSYDLGQKDSIVKDSSVIRLFYPRVRFEHVFQLSHTDDRYIDVNTNKSDYLTYYNYIVASDTLLFRDRWRNMTNELAIYTYPDKKNQAQYFKVDGGWQWLTGSFGQYLRHSYTTLYGGAEYRNQTRNRKWDMEAVGKLYLTGTYAGDYSAYVSLRRNVSNLGALQVGAENVNRTLSYVFNVADSGQLSFDTTGSNYKVNPHTDFPVQGSGNWKKENILHAFANLGIDALKIRLSGNYYAVTNYGYFDGYFSAKQYGSIFNVLQLGAQKETKLNKYFKWYIEAYLQQKAGGAPLNIPLFMMRNRIAFEGNFFKNLFLATGLEVRYNSPYKADSYSPFTGQFFYQNETSISNRPDVSYYLNFRITRFRFFGQISNLNTMNYSKTQGFGFNKYNFSAPLYPQAGLWMRFGFRWMFVN